MRGYRRLLTASVLVGSTTPGRVKPGRAGPFLEYEISDRDRVVLAAGLRDAARLFLAAGAARVFPSTFGWREIRSVGALEYLDLSAEDLLLTSAHPQGGNAIGTVVDDDFRVRGMRNLRICDASVFPTSVHVDPQITVMAVAQYAAGRMLVS
jgi:choline dehydrogenase-like flavoprotein